jgi:uncharacterized membrane protein
MNNLIRIYILNKKQNNYLIISSLIAITMLLLRVKLTHSIYLLFLLWNLFLAAIPYSLSTIIKTDFRLRRSNLKNLGIIIIWLLFIPNTFYLITDFVHLNPSNLYRYIFDFALLSSFTIAGFYFGILSINTIYKQIQFFYSNTISRIFLISISYLCAFGIYIGRVLRFNSWDIISNPFSLIKSILDSIFLLETVVFSVELGTLILIVNSIYIQFNSDK